MSSPRAGWCAKLADFCNQFMVQISTSATATFSAPVQVRPTASVTPARARMSKQSNSQNFRTPRRATCLAYSAPSCQRWRRCTRSG